MKTSPAALKPENEPAAPTELGVLSNVLGFRLRRIHSLLSKSMLDTLAQGSDLTAGPVRTGEFSALALIAANPGISQIGLARVGGFDKTSVVMMVDDMEARGWALRRRSTADRRRHTLHVTAAGEAMLSELDGMAQANEARINQALTAEERRRLYDMLDRIYEICLAAEG